MNRRSFISKTSLILGGLGVHEAFKIDLLDKIARTILPEARASTAQPQRLLEICFREGHPLIQYAVGKEFTTLSAPKYSNFPYVGSQIIPGVGTTNMFFNTSSAPLAAHAANIAITQGITSDGGHTEMFNIRKGATNSSLTTPIVTLANQNTTGAIVPGVQWPGDAVNFTNGARDLTQLGGTSDYINLFQGTTLQISDPELTTILNAAAALSAKQAALLQTKLTNASMQAASISSAGQLFGTLPSRTTDTNDLAYAGLNSDVPVNHPPGCCGGPMPNYADARQAIAMSLLGFQYNLINSSMVVVDMGDWHPLQQVGDTNPLTGAISQTLADAISFLKATPEPAGAPGQTLWDTTVIVGSSEFNRGIAQFGNDNNDGDTQGIMLIGKNVVGNYYGSFDLTGTGKGVAYGIDGATGASSIGTPTNSTLQGYYTVLKLLGLSTSIGESQMALNAMLST